MNLSLFKLKSTKRGFSLIEVLVSATIFIVAMMGVIALISLNIAYTALLPNRLIAANLVQEGIEIVKNIRDNNFLLNADDVYWDNNLNNDNNKFCVAHNRDELFNCSNAPLRFHPATGLFDYEVPGEPSIFRRTINITRINDNEIKVTSTATWQERGAQKSLTADAHLFNWE